MKFTVVEGTDRGEVKLYTLSSCAWCDKVKELLSRLGVTYQYIDTDLLDQSEQDEIVAFLDSITEKWGFPVLLIHGKYMLSGYQEKSTRKLLGFDENAGTEEKEATREEEDPEIDQAWERLKKFSSKKGYFLNPDKSITRKLIKSLLLTQQRYGYWACPCRLSSGNREAGKDIICPCDYMLPDVRDFGACFCALYVSEVVFRGKAVAESVPERRRKKDTP